MNRHKHPVPALLLALSMPLMAAANDWDSATSPTLKSEQPADLLIHGRPFEVYQHGVKKDWGYKDPQQDTFIVVHPKKRAPQRTALRRASFRGT